MLFVSFRFNSFEPQHSKNPSRLKPTTSKLPALVLPCWANRMQKPKSLSEVFTCSSEQQQLHRVRIQTHNLQTSSSDTWMSCLWAFWLFIWRAVFKYQTDSRIAFTISELLESSRTVSYLDIKCLDLNFSLCTGSLSLFVCVSIRSLPSPNISSAAARCIRKSSCCSRIRLHAHTTSPRYERH